MIFFYPQLYKRLNLVENVYLVCSDQLKCLAPHLWASDVLCISLLFFTAHTVGSTSYCYKKQAAADYSLRNRY